jgi:glycyl-tRNA synthetase beta subunit
MSHDLLFEIGVEELPSSFVAGALAALPALFEKHLATLRLKHGAIRALGTPRRLAVIVSEIAERQPDLWEELTGPPVTAAYDKQGKPTRAAEAFAAKLGCAAARGVKTASLLSSYSGRFCRKSSRRSPFASRCAGAQAKPRSAARSSGSSPFSGPRSYRFRSPA